MRIANNIMAMNTYRQYTVNNDNVAKSAEKLSSGYRINRAGDDAAGLAISEKMRAQVRGLNMAAKNSQDAISLVQTAEGALQEVHSMLQRMNELAVQSASGTNETFDRSAISAEFDQLKDEIDQISEQTTFNNMKILDGTLGGQSAVLKTGLDGAAVTASATNSFVAGGNIKGAVTGAGVYTVASQSAITTSAEGVFTLDTGILSDAGVWTDVADATATNLRISFAGSDGSTKEYTMKLDDVLKGNTYGATNQVFTLDLTAAGLGTQTITYTQAAASNTATALMGQIDGAKITTAKGNSSADFSDAALNIQSMTDADVGNYAISAVGNDVTFTNKTTGNYLTKTLDTSITSLDLSSIGLGKINLTSAYADAAAVTAAAAAFDSIGSFSITGGTEGGSAMKIQIGALEGEQLSVAIGNMDTGGLGIATQSIASQAGAGSAVTATRNAINKVSDQRALLGAMQNRLEHKISNLNISSENLNAAESRIRDVDIAKEMTNYTKNNILSQAATAMLAQANSAPQNVLSLLK